MSDPATLRALERLLVANRASPASLAPRRSVAGEQLERWCGKNEQTTAEAMKP